MTKIFPLYNIDLNSIDSPKDFSNINHDINKIFFFDLKIDYNFDSKNEKIEIKSFPFEIIKEYKENKKENINTNKIFNYLVINSKEKILKILSRNYICLINSPN